VPELPEVETVVRDLRPLLVGRRIENVWVGRLALRKPWTRGWSRRVRGRRVEAVRRRGKWIVLDLDDGASLVFHLGMSGWMSVRSPGDPTETHTHLILDFDGGKKQLRFRDPRRFGSATLFSDRVSLEAFFASSGLGPEPFDLDPVYWRRRLTSARRSLKTVLTDQTVVAGVGNIYADEALFEARLHPARLASTLTAREAERLRRAVEAVLNRAIEHGGADLGDGVYPVGRMQNEFRVYRRTGKPCPRCGTPIQRVRLAGRSAHFCPSCQKS
jgi:formamidopyrimidine-DNA glycosylase